MNKLKKTVALKQVLEQLYHDDIEGALQSHRPDELIDGSHETIRTPAAAREWLVQMEDHAMNFIDAIAAESKDNSKIRFAARRKAVDDWERAHKKLTKKSKGSK